MKVTITREMLASAQTNAGGFTRTQLDVFNIGWPPPKGWPNSLIGREVDSAQFDRFVQAREIYSKQRKASLAHAQSSIFDAAP